VIVLEAIPMEDAKALVIYWHETHYFATKMYTKLLVRARETCPAYSTITNWIRTLTRGEDIQGHASAAHVYSMTELILWSSTRLKIPLFIQWVR
jgi:hypothetical protein